MGLTSFRRQETSNIITTPNGLSAARGIGGVLLGAFLAARNIDPETALISASALAATDGEGLLIQATSRWPRLQRALKIVPSSIGRKLDPVMDKIYAFAIFGGAAIGGQIPLEEAAAIGATEAATVLATYSAIRKGGDPEVSKAGTWGMVARIGAIATNLTAHAVDSGVPQEILYGAGAASTVAGVVLGALSIQHIRSYAPHETVPEPPVQADSIAN